MVDLTPLIPQGRQVVEGYGPSHFRVSGQVYESPILVLPGRTLAWPVTAFEEITVESLQPVIDSAGEVDLLLLGTGPRLRPPPAGLRAALKAAGIAIEAMDSGAACRTYNVLMAEGRRIAAALLPAG
jgi:uncharacterized protein